MSSHVRGAILFRLAIRHTQLSTYAAGLCSSGVLIGGCTGGLTFGPNSVYFIEVYLFIAFFPHRVQLIRDNGECPTAMMSSMSETVLTITEEHWRGIANRKQRKAAQNRLHQQAWS
jgi:hypothetical protein